jgi:hypothetical protein
MIPEDGVALSRQIIFVAGEGYRIVDDTTPTVINGACDDPDFFRFLERVLPLGPIPHSYVIED